MCNLLQVYLEQMKKVIMILWIITKRKWKMGKQVGNN